MFLLGASLPHAENYRWAPPWPILDWIFIMEPHSAPKELSRCSKNICH
jgi:hypothetical protein